MKYLSTLTEFYPYFLYILDVLLPERSRHRTGRGIWCPSFGLLLPTKCLTLENLRIMADHRSVEADLQYTWKSVLWKMPYSKYFHSVIAQILPDKSYFICFKCEVNSYLEDCRGSNKYYTSCSFFSALYKCYFWNEKSLIPKACESNLLLPEYRWKKPKTSTNNKITTKENHMKIKKITFFSLNN